MARQTSLEAYEFLKSSGALTAMQDRVIAALAHAEPGVMRMTGGECVVRDYSRTASELAQELRLPRDSVSPRLAELRRRGLVKEVGVRECAVTGHTTNAFVIAEPDEVRANAANRRVKVLPRKKLQELVEKYEAALAECKTEDGAVAFAKDDLCNHAEQVVRDDGSIGYYHTPFAHKRLYEINKIVETALMGAVT